METREKILATAVKLFSSQGYADTSLAQVARAARVSKALVLWYFESKEQLFRAALQHFLAPYEIDDHVLDGLARELHIIYRGLLTTILERGRAKGFFAETVRPTEDAALIMATLNGLLLHQLVEALDATKARELLTRLKYSVRAQLEQTRRTDTTNTLETEATQTPPPLLRTGS